MSRYLAIDPGVDGAIALWIPDAARLVVYDMPTLLRKGSKKRDVDGVSLAHTFDALRGFGDVTLALIERAGTRPNESRASAHTNGRNWGVAFGVLCAQLVPTEIVTPAKWKAAMKLTADKDYSRTVATALLPEHAHNWPLKKHHDRAEASLLAVYGERFHATQKGLA